MLALPPLLRLAARFVTPKEDRQETRLGKSDSSQLLILNDGSMNAIPNPHDPETPLPTKCLVIVGMPGAGKSTIGRRLAARLGLAFIDADHEIEKAAGMSIPEIFAQLGEPSFREGERRVIARLLEGTPCVLATGGGAFMDASTRDKVKEHGISIWLDVSIDTLAERTARNTNRPLIQNSDPRASLIPLFEKRGPIYALADIHVASNDGPAEGNVERVLDALTRHIQSLSEKVTP